MVRLSNNLHINLHEDISLTQTNKEPPSPHVTGHVSSSFEFFQIYLMCIVINFVHEIKQLD